MSSFLKRWFALAILALIPSSAQAEDDLYLDIIKPILRARCYACHGTLKQAADLKVA